MKWRKKVGRKDFREMVTMIHHRLEKWKQWNILRNYGVCSRYVLRSYLLGLLKIKFII